MATAGRPMQLAVNLRERDEASTVDPTQDSAMSSWPAVPLNRLLFRDLPITWDQCVESWQRDQDGKGHPVLYVHNLAVSVLGEPPGAGGDGAADCAGELEGERMPTAFSPRPCTRGRGVGGEGDAAWRRGKTSNFLAASASPHPQPLSPSTGARGEVTLAGRLRG